MSRAYLTDSWRGVVVIDADGGHWLATTLDALAPDEEAMVLRGEAEGGPPRAYGSVSLVKILMSWGTSSGETDQPVEIAIANPRVIRHPGGASIGMVPLERNRDFAEQVRRGSGPVCHSIAGIDSTVGYLAQLEIDRVDVETLLCSDDGSCWPVRRRAWFSSMSGTGFLGQPGATALDLSVERTESGSPAFSYGESPPPFLGIVRPAGAHVAMLLSSRLIAETVAHAKTDGPGAAVAQLR